MLTDLYNIQAYAETLVKHARTKDGKTFSVKFDRKVDFPFTIERKSKIEIVLPEFNARMTEQDLTLARWFMTHEIAHHTEGPEFHKLLEDNGLNDPTSPLGSVFTAFEDGRIEKASAKKYAGDAKVFSEALEIFNKHTIEKFKDKGFPDDENLAKMGACIVAELESRSDWNGGAASTYHDYEALLPEQGKEALKKIRDNGLIDVLKNTQSEQDTLDVAKQVYELIWEQSAEEHIQQQQQKMQEGEGDQQQKGEDDSSDGGGKGNSKGDGQKGDGQEEGENGEGKGTPVEGFQESDQVVDYQEFLNSKHGNKEEMLDGASASGVSFDYTNHKGDWSTYVPTPWEDICVAHFHKKRYFPPSIKNRAERTNSDYHEMQRCLENVHAAHGEPGRGFGNKVRRHLQTLSQARYVGGHKSGRLHRKKAYRIGVPQVGNGEWNSQIFRQKHQQDILDIAVTILTDFSGSMHGDKVAHAMDASMLLNRTISTTLHIPTQLLTFSDGGCDCFIGVCKDFDERLSDEEVLDNMFKSGNFMSRNPDGDAIMWAYRQLRGRKEKRKLLLVLSDGSPASGRPGDDMAFTQKVVKEIEQEGIVEIIGLGIKDRNVERIYKRNATIKKASELENAVLKLVTREIIK